MSMQLNGWRDLKMVVSSAATGSGAPSLANFGPSASGSIKQLSFGVGDSVYLIGHFEHDIRIGSTVFPHIHWTTNGTSVNTVKWQLTYTLAMGHDQDNFGNDVVLTLEEAAAGTAWRHMITEDATGFSSTDIEPDSLIVMELERITNGGSENADTVFAMFGDLHYQVQQYASLNRNPLGANSSFYR